jgi:hypothetical protein
MREGNLQVSVIGVPDELAQAIGNAVGETAFAIGDLAELDLRRMHRMVVATDFAAALTELSKENPSRKPLTSTQEEYGTAIAQVCLLPKDDGLEIVPVLSANMFANLVKEDDSDESLDKFRYSLHLLHHELCHVHDDNKKIDSFHNIVLKKGYSGKDNYIRPLTEVIWSEYIANVMSSSTAHDAARSMFADMLAEGVERTKTVIDEEIEQYRKSFDLERIRDVLHRQGDFLIKCAAYCLGYVDGKDDSDFSAKTVTLVSGTYFEDTFTALHQALRQMRSLYPGQWQDMSVYDGLAAVVDNYYRGLGFIYSDTDNGGVWLSIPDHGKGK